jgi:hypothetical protein
MAGLVPAIDVFDGLQDVRPRQARVTIDDNDRRLSPDRNAVLA